MNLSSLNLGNYGTSVYEDHAVFLLSTLTPKSETAYSGKGEQGWKKSHIRILEYYTLIRVWFLGSYYNTLYLTSLYFFGGVLQTRDVV